MELKKRKGLFYSADALLAVSILFLFMLLVVPLTRVNVQKSDLQYDIISSMSATKIGDLELSNLSAQGDLDDMIANGRINDSSKNVLEALGELYIQDKPTGQWLAKEIFSGIDSEYNFGIWIGDSLIYNKSDTNYTIAALEYVDVARQPISGIMEGENITGFAARAFLSKTMNTKYYYFGGYVGDGNISMLINYEGNLSSVDMEIAISNNFDLYIGNNYAGNYNKSISEYSPARYSLPVSNFTQGDNIIEIRNATNRSSISGGFVKINYKSDIELDLEDRYYFSGVKGVINIYDGFYFPGNINSMNIYLNYSSPQNISLIIGNKTVYQGNSSGDSVTSINDTVIKNYLGGSYASISGKNVPIRIGMDAALESEIHRIGNADVVFVSDRSGSMYTDNINGSFNGNIDCGMRGTQSVTPTTKRIVVLRCLLGSFISILLSGNGNNISLVSYGDVGVEDVGLTSNITLLNETIDDSYISNIGYTCISCGVTTAYNVLEGSNNNRSKFIIVMTDGLANRAGAYSDYWQSNKAVYSLDSYGNKTFFVGQDNLFVEGDYNYFNRYLWDNITGFITNSNLRDIKIYNSTLGLAVGDNGNVYRWNGATWSGSDINSDSNDLFAVDIYNSTLGFAVGESGYVHNWTGSGWSARYDIGVTLRDIKIYNSTLGFAVGDNGNVYRWNGTWSSGNDINVGSNLDLFSVDIYNSTLAFAVGESGYVHNWTGSGWSAGYDIGVTLRDVDIYNSTLAFAVGQDGNVYRWNGTWSSGNDINGGSSQDFYNVKIINSTLSYVSGEVRNIQYFDGSIFVWGGNTWSPLDMVYEDYLFLKNGSDFSYDETPPCSDSVQGNGAARIANFTSYRARQNLNVTVHSVGFSIDNCKFGNDTVKSMADSGKGNWTASSDSSKLSKWFRDIAETILNVSFNEQKSDVLGNLYSTLSPYSYIEFNYNKPSLPTGIRFSIEKKFSQESNGNFNLLPGDSLIDARVTSYSGPKWTNLVYLNNSLFYNLSSYGNNTNLLGDPFNIYLPLNLINLPGNNLANLSLYPSGVNGSLNNSIIYTILRNITAYSDIGSGASGCKWHIKTESNGVIDIKVPSDYPDSGTNNCYFNSTNPINYLDGTYNDVYILATYSLLKQLDANNNNETDINLEEDFFEIDTSTVSGIPLEWKTQVQVRIWK